MSTWKYKLNLISQEVFQYTIIAYLLIIVIENIQIGFVSYFFNPNILLLFVLTSAILMLFTHQYQINKTEKDTIGKITGKELEYIVYLALGSAVLVFYKTQEVGQISITLTIFTALAIVLLAILLRVDKK